MYTTVFKADPLDPARGKQYRDKILRVGGSREELDSLKVTSLHGPSGMSELTYLVGFPWSSA